MKPVHPTINCPFCTRPCKGIIGFWSHAQQLHGAAIALIRGIDLPLTPDQWSDEREILEERIRQLEAKVYGVGWEPPAELALTGHETAIMQTLIAHDRVVSHALLYDATRNAPYSNGKDVDDKIVHIRISIIRKKLRAFGLEIMTVWGCGYRLAPESRLRLLNWNTEPKTQVVA